MELDERIVQKHEQLSCYSCIPMAVDLILKLLGRVTPDYLELQNEWNDRNKDEGQSAKALVCRTGCLVAAANRGLAAILTYKTGELPSLRESTCKQPPTE